MWIATCFGCVGQDINSNFIFSILNKDLKIARGIRHFYSYPMLIRRFLMFLSLRYRNPELPEQQLA